MVLVMMIRMFYGVRDDDLCDILLSRHHRKLMLKSQALQYCAIPIRPAGGVTIANRCCHVTRVPYAEQHVRLIMMTSSLSVAPMK